MQFLYNILIQLYGFALQIAAQFHLKAKLWIVGRKNWKENLHKKININIKYCWIHCASAGEFEQAIPLITAIKNKNLNLKICVSFFSPSGFDMYKNSDWADVFFYFPLDTKTNAKQLIDVLNPVFVIFIRNEIWLNTLTILHQKNIPTFLVNVNTEQQRNFFYKKYLEKTYSLFTKIFDTQTYGHTKLEKVIYNKNNLYTDTIFDDFCKDSFVIIVGSSWHEEEQYILDFYKKNKVKYPNLKIIIAAHEQLSISLFEIEKLSNNLYSLYSAYQPSNILILDKKGILKYAYQYANIAIIGGGFGKGIHNVAEAAIYGIPTVLGYNYNKFEETVELVNIKAAFVVNNYDEFENKIIELINNVALRNNIKTILDDYFSKQTIVSEKIISIIVQELK